MKLQSLLFSLATLTATILMAGCKQEPIQTESIALDSNNLTMVKGDTHQLTATITPENSDDEIIWKSSDESVVTVSPDGLVKAEDFGEATVSVYSGNVSARCQITVTNRRAESVTIEPSELSIMKCEETTLKATIIPEDSDERIILWSTSDEKIASIDENGKLTANAVGKVTIKASVGEVFGTCEVTVEGIPATGLALEPSNADVLLGYNVKLKAVITPDNADERDVQWSSSDESVCTVDSEGVVNAISVGNATITATLGKFTAKCEIEVTLPEAKVGDFYYSDGTWSTEKDDSKECIGIVFYVGQHENDESDYSSSGIGKTRCNGYVVALQNILDEYCIWGPTGKEIGCFPMDEFGNSIDNYNNNSGDADWSGYKYTYLIKAEAEANGGLSTGIATGYPAVAHTLQFEETVPTPENSTGWFLPAISQLWCVFENRQLLEDAGAGMKVDWYWSSSEDYWGPSQGALGLNMNSSNVRYNMKNSNTNLIRPVLAF